MTAYGIIISRWGNAMTLPPLPNAHVPAVLALTGAALVLFTRERIPERKQPLTDVSPRVFAAHLALLEKSPAVDKTLAEVRKMAGGTLKVTSIERGKGKFLLPLPEIVLHPGDHLVIRDTPERLKEYEKVLQGALYPEKYEDGPVAEDHPLQAENQQVAEIAIVERSKIPGKSLADLRFAERYGLITPALHRSGQDFDRFHDEIGDITLKAGDVQLVQGP